MIFNKNKLRKADLIKERDSLEKEVYDLKKKKAKISHEIEMKYVQREKDLEIKQARLDNDIKLFEQNKCNFNNSITTL